MICIHHNRDMDGYASAAVVKRKYPEADLIGWDYAEEMPDFEQFVNQDIIMIDITFKLHDILRVAAMAKSLLIIDHHVGIRKDWEAWVGKNRLAFGEDQELLKKITYKYINGLAACEIGWDYFFPEESKPEILTLLGRYDTWRKDQGDWEGETLPFQYGIRVICNSAETFPDYLFERDDLLPSITANGDVILAYQRQENAKYAKGAFEMDFGGLRAICLNSNLFSSQVFDTVYDEAKHDVMVPFCYQHGQWKCSIYSTKPNIDCSELAKARGGGGHKGAAGFEVKNFEDIFK